jgi:hypothetical protein
MGKSAKELALRNPAAAALYGLMGSDFGTEVASEPEMFSGEGDADFGVDFGDEAYDGGFADLGDMGENLNPWGLGEENLGGSDFGADVRFGEEHHPHHPGHPGHPGRHPAHHHGATPEGRAIIAHHMRKQEHRNRRAMLLEPNKYSDLKVERYTFSINANIPSLGTPAVLTASNAPDVNFRPQRVTANVVSPGMVLISDARVANVSFTVGGQLDAWTWNANGVGQQLDVPTLTPANKASFIASYSGLVPSPLSGTGTYPFSLTFTGPASIVA